MAAVIFWAFAIPFAWNAAMAYPSANAKPIEGTFTPLVFSPANSSISTETFIIPKPNQTISGPMPYCTVSYSVNGSTITSETPLTLTVTVFINAFYTSSLGYSVDPTFVSIDNSELLDVAPNHTVVPYGVASPQLNLVLISNNSKGTTYSTSYHPYNNTSLPIITDTISVGESGYLTGSVFMFVGQSSSWSEGLDIRNTTQINVQSMQDLQLQNETVQLDNANSENNIETQYNVELNLYNGAVLLSLERLIAAFVLAELGLVALELRH